MPQWPGRSGGRGEVNCLNSEMITLYQIIFSRILDRNAKKPQVMTAANKLTANMNLSYSSNELLPYQHTCHEPQKRSGIKITIMLCFACEKRKQV